MGVFSKISRVETMGGFDCLRPGKKAGHNKRAGGFHPPPCDIMKMTASWIIERARQWRNLIPGSFFFHFPRVRWRQISERPMNLFWAFSRVIDDHAASIRGAVTTRAPFKKKKWTTTKWRLENLSMNTNGSSCYPLSLLTNKKNWNKTK